jgi:hypothetical protein
MSLLPIKMNKKTIFALFFIVVLTVGVFFAVWQSQKQQEIRQRAAEIKKTEEAVCPVAKAICKWDTIAGVDEYYVTITNVTSSASAKIIINNQKVATSPGQLVFLAEKNNTYKCDVISSNVCGKSATASAEATCPGDKPTPTPTTQPTVTPIPPTNEPTPTITPTAGPTAIPTPTNPPVIWPTSPLEPVPTRQVLIWPTNPPGQTVLPTNPQPTRSPQPTIAPAGSSNPLMMMGISATVITILGALIFLVL